MNRFSAVLLGVCIIVMMLFNGCGSSEGSYGKQESASSSPTSTTQTGDQSGSQIKTDTLNVDVVNSPKPLYEAPGKFSVQVGAYKNADGAEQIAALARERFGKNVYTIHDTVNDLYKVMVGEFTVKDDARKFRDDMVQKYPNDYKDAWVAELSQK